MKLFAAALLFCARQVVASQITIQIAPSSPRECARTSLLIQQCVDGVCTEARRVPFQGSRVAVNVSEEGSTRVAFESSDCWIAPIERRAGAPADVEVRAWPRASVEGTLSVPEGTVAELEAVIAPDGVVVPEILQRCTVVKSHWRCDVPSTTVSLRLQVPGLAPRNLWNVRAGPNVKTDVGAIAFLRGATITGTVRTGRVAERNIALELRQEGFGRREAIGHARLARGRYEFAGVAPGTYRIVGRAKSMPPAQSESVVVAADVQYAVREMRFAEMAVLKLLVAPAVDAQQRPWQLALKRALPRSTETMVVAREALDPTGWWERGGLEAGLYFVTISDADGAVLDSRQITITAGMPVVDIHLSQIPVRGTVRIGAEAIAASLRFIALGLQSGRKVSMRSDADGVFVGFLPHEGQWNVRIEVPDRKSFVTKNGVEVKRRNDEAYARVDLVLASGRIKGSVIDTSGKPMTEICDVMMFRNGAFEADAGSDAEGRFELFGIEPGAVTLQARNRLGESGIVAYRVSEEAVSDVQLVFSKRHTVIGTILTADAYPLAGAVVRFITPAMTDFIETVSGPDGQFEFQLTEDSQNGTIAILAIGLPIKIQPVSFVADTRPRLVMGVGAGELLVPMTRDSRTPLIAPPGGVSLSLRALVFPPDGSGSLVGIGKDGFAISMEPGSYSICGGPLDCEAVTIRMGEQTIVRRNQNGDGK